MFEVLQDFEQTAAWFSPIVLVGPGLTAVIVGLFVWLGGLGFTRVLVAVLGAVSGGICGFFIIGRNIMATAVLAVAAALIAIILQRIFITILAACLVAALGFAVLARPYIESSQGAIQTNQSRMSVKSSALSVGESVQLMKAYIIVVSDKVKQDCLQMPLYNWAIIVALVVISIVAGFYLWRLTSALCCAVLGAVLIFAGMILLLLYKGSVPISGIYRSPSFYAAVFITMAAFGTVEQLLLCPWLKTKAIRRKEAKKDKAARRKHKWRTT